MSSNLQFPELIDKDGSIVKRPHSGINCVNEHFSSIDTDMAFKLSQSKHNPLDYVDHNVCNSLYLNYQDWYMSYKTFTVYC